MTVYAKPMIYYPLTTLMQAGIRELLIISTAQDLPRLRQLPGDETRWTVSALPIEEMPRVLELNCAVTGLYFADGGMCDIAAGRRPSARGEIADINRAYLSAGRLQVEPMGRGMPGWIAASMNPCSMPRDSLPPSKTPGAESRGVRENGIADGLYRRGATARPGRPVHRICRFPSQLLKEGILK